MKKRMMMLVAAPLVLAGCQGSQSYNIPVQPKWPGAPYRLALGAQPAKPNPVGLTIPPVKYTANPDALETRADLVIRVDTSGVKRAGPIPDIMIMAPTDISGAQGALAADYLDAASNDLAKMLASDGMKGAVKVSIALTQSSLSMSPSDDEVNDKRLSDWLPLVVDFKGAHHAKG